MLPIKKLHKIISEDTFIWQEVELMVYLYECLTKDQDVLLDFQLEGPCARTNGLYNILDLFCNATGYQHNRITIRTGNLIESHSYYNIKKTPEYWYEIKLIQTWLTTVTVNTGTTPIKHFGSFIGRSTWARLWIASVLYENYSNKTIQTFHSGLQENYVVAKDHSVYDVIGLDDLNKYECSNIWGVVKFLNKCPIQLDKNYTATNSYIAPVNGDYPIQHPANLQILNYYNNFFVDIVTETRMNGNLFFATEKIWRPIVARRPFIVVGSQHFLQNLKKLGFQTFNNFWDEGYDDYAATQRMEHIEQLLGIIAAWPVDLLHQKLLDIQQILDHNYNRFNTLTYQQIGQVFDE